MPKQEVVVLCQVFYPDTQSTSQLLSDVLSSLAQGGCSVTILSGYPGLDNGGVPPKDEVWAGITIRRGGLRASVKKNLWLRAMTYLSYSWHVVWQLLRMRKTAKVVVVTNPPFLPILAWLICRLRGHSFKVMLQDIYPDGLVAVGRLHSGGIIDRLWRWANGRAYRAACAIWVLGRDMAQLVQQRYQVPTEKVCYLPHWSVVPIDTPVRPEDTQLWSRLKLEGKFVVQYSGNMGLWHDIESIVRAAALLQDHPEIQFLLIGQGMRQKQAEELSRDLSLSNIIWLPYQDRETLADSLSCCHAAIISQRGGLEGVAVPCKLYGILASGRAIIAQVPSASEVALTVTEENCGRVIAPGNAEALAACIRDLESSRTDTQRMGTNAHEAYRVKYTLAAGAAAFERGIAEWPTPSR